MRNDVFPEERGWGHLVLSGLRGPRTCMDLSFGTCSLCAPAHLSLSCSHFTGGESEDQKDFG